MWFVTDKWGNRIELTEERWAHIRESHWELSRHLEDVLLTVRTGRRKQSPIDPHKYTYYKDFNSLPHNYTRIVVIVKLIRNNFIITAYPIRKRI
ncbi:MAG: hypothetical protein OXT74_15185 [Candidatus Poribacteria bacterium]|nr:hypothetical protein [Candidatus Poribacteria bacterium]